MSGQHAQGDRQTPFMPRAHPWPRGSISFSLRVSCGLPVVTTSVGGLVEATAGYTGAVLVPPCDPAALAEGIRTALPLVDTAHADPHSWARNAERYAALLDRIDAGWSSDGRVPGDRAEQRGRGGRMTGSALRVGVVVPSFRTVPRRHGDVCRHTRPPLWPRAAPR